MEIISLIPARAGSKGVLDKNIRNLGGHPLLEWSIKASLLSESISRTIVSTDSVSYQEIAISSGAEAPFLRPPSISADTSGDIEFVLHALTELEKSGYTPDYIVHLRPTTPIRKPEVIEEAISTLNNDGVWTSLRSVHEMSESAYKSFEIEDSDFLVSTFVRNRDLEKSNFGRQEFPKTYQANGYVDILSVEEIKNTGKIHGNSVLAFLTEPVIEIDTSFDFELAEAICQSRPELAERLFG